jgi:hypothetical protein
MEIRYLVDCRPDLHFTLNVSTKSMHKPTKRLQQLAHRTLGYLLHTKDYRMRFAPEDLQLRACVDASYGVHADCKSHYGVLLRVGHSSAAIHARSSIIKVVTRSALESELYAINDIASEILFQRDIMNEIGYLQGPTIVGEDNQGVISLLHGPDLNYQTRSKHVRIRYAFIKEQILNGRIAVEYTPTTLQQADTLTKPTIGALFLQGVHWLMGITHAA